MGIEILLALSWALSLAFVFSLGVGQGYRQAHRERLQMVEAVKSGIFQLVERFSNGKGKHAETAGFGDSYGAVGRGSVQDQQKGQENASASA